MAAIMLRYIPSIPSFLRGFIMKWCWILSKAFSASVEMIRWFLSLLLLMRCITFIEPSLHPWDETNLVMVNDLSDILLDSVYHYFIEDFYTNVHQGDWPVALFFGCVLVWFWDVYNTGFIE
jgi:hypothetical protein